MKKIYVYLLGVLTGIILTFVIAFIISICGNSNNQSDALELEGLELFDAPGQVMDFDDLTVFQVVNQKAALASDDDDILSNALVYDESMSFYDHLHIHADNGKCFKQIGTFHYESKMGYKTVPVVALFDR